MTDEVIRAEFEALQKAEADFKQVLHAFEDALTELDHKVRASLARWEGDARDAYQVVHDEWVASARDMHAALADLHKTLGVAHGNYRSALQANLRMWQV